jgi:precorrin-3B synthase
VPGGRHVGVTEAGLERGDVAALTAGAEEVIVTPWRGVLVPEVTT